MTHLRRETGFTLIELLVTMTLLVVVVTATLATFNVFERNSRINERQNDAQDAARLTLGRVVKQLRNLASPTAYQPESVERARDNDLVFQTVDPVRPDGTQNDRNIKRVRYCLDVPAADGRANLWTQSQTWVSPNPPPPQPAAEGCPGDGWPNRRLVARNIVNVSANRPVFSYTPNASDLKAIFGIQAELMIDVNPGRSPAVSRLASGVFLRNQNRAPNAFAEADYTGTSRRIVLNASASEDPEGHPLKTYRWSVSCAGCTPPKDGIVSHWDAPGPGTYVFTLEVEDHAGLVGRYTTPGVVVPS